MMELLERQAERATNALVESLAPVGNVSYEPRLGGFGIFESGVMFGFVDIDGITYLRAGPATAERFFQLGAEKHPQMPYWTIPQSVADDADLLTELAYEASDLAHLAHRPLPDNDQALSKLANGCRATQRLLMLVA